ncbi:hypothetical protein ACEWY4_018249 [Coilia grayii]|uniref:Uncharacterized protein n=1 Tax=Coilia grayii TaxID=363190 RepID=A0ABD1JKJ7_9TELE
MRLCDLFRCCLPVPERDSDGNMASSKIKGHSNRKEKTGEKANPSQKKLRKEAKRLKKERADRWRNGMEMAMIEAHSDLIKGVPLAEVKERVRVKVEALNSRQDLTHQAMVHGGQDGQDANSVFVVMSSANANGDSQIKEPKPVSHPTLEEERRERLLSWFDRRRAAKQMSDTVCSVTKPESAHPNWSDQKLPSLDDLEEERRLQLLAWSQRRGLTTLKAAGTQAAESYTFLDNGRPQLAEGGERSPSLLVTDGDRQGTVICPTLDPKKYQPRVRQGEQPRRLTPQEKDVLEEQRRLQLLAWFQRRGLTTLKAAETQAAESCTGNNNSHEGHENILPQ